MANIHILLTQSSTLLSRIIAEVSGANFTHASISTDEIPCNFYSFARRTPYFPLPAGLVREAPNAGYWALHPEIPCLLLSLPVDDVVHIEIEQMIGTMMASAELYRYSLLGLLLCGADFALERKHHYFCSQFIGYLLKESGAIPLPCAPSLLRPDNLLTLPGATVTYQGKIGDLSARCETPHSLYPPIFTRKEAQP